MKYIVMECHEGYAVLMDEESRFVNAANMHYEVGQSVTDPIIMNEEHTARRITFTAGKLIAAAACLVLFTSAGSIYYTRNLKPHSTVLISSDANIKMELNKKGKVLHIVSDSEIGKELLKDYNGKGKDKLTAANEIIELEIEKGYITNGDTIDLYISSDNSGDYESFKSDFENGITDMKVSVHDIDSLNKPSKPTKPTDNVKKPDPPKHDTVKTPEKPAADNNVKTPQPPAQTAVAAPPAHADPPAHDAQPPKEDKKTDTPAPPSPPSNAAEPEPPKAPEKPDAAAQPETPKPEAPAEPAKPALPNEGEPVPPEAGLHEKLTAETDKSDMFELKVHSPVSLLPEHETAEELLPAAEPPASELPSPEAEHSTPQLPPTP